MRERFCASGNYGFSEKFCLILQDKDGTKLFWMAIG